MSGRVSERVSVWEGGVNEKCANKKQKNNISRNVGSPPTHKKTPVQAVAGQGVGSSISRGRPKGRQRGRQR